MKRFSFYSTNYFKVHEKHPHCGINSTLTFIWHNFWIGRGRQMVKKLLKNCILCKIVQVKTALSQNNSCYSRALQLEQFT